MLLFLLKHLLMNDFSVTTGWRYCIREGGEELISAISLSLVLHSCFRNKQLCLNIYFFCVNIQVLHCWDNHCSFCLTEKTQLFILFS